MVRSIHYVSSQGWRAYSETLDLYLTDPINDLEEFLIFWAETLNCSSSIMLDKENWRIMAEYAKNHPLKEWQKPVEPYSSDFDANEGGSKIPIIDPLDLINPDEKEIDRRAIEDLEKDHIRER